MKIIMEKGLRHTQTAAEDSATQERNVSKAKVATTYLFLYFLNIGFLLLLFVAGSKRFFHEYFVKIEVSLVARCMGTKQ